MKLPKLSKAIFILGAWTIKRYRFYFELTEAVTRPVLVNKS